MHGFHRVRGVKQRSGGGASGLFLYLVQLKLKDILLISKDGW